MPVVAAPATTPALPSAPYRAGRLADLVPPLSDAEFAARMAPFAPFEHAPALAVAVSGGRDSMCLALLADRWAFRHGGAAIAVTVDHGLRAESAIEARQVGAWLSARGIRHAIVPWTGPHPKSGIQAAARAARYRLLDGFCRDRGILHLLAGHHRDDQAETVLLRRERASGGDGLAAMAAVRELDHARLLRPLLDVPRERLTATLQAAGQDWIDDPSNQNTAMARGRLRRTAAGSERVRVLASTQANARARLSAERATAGLAARALRLHAAGYATLDRAILASAAPGTGERLLARTAMTVAGRAYPPRSARTQRAYAAMIDAGPFAGRTLGGCRLVGQGELVHVCREAARIGPRVRLAPGVQTVWDERFSVSVTKNLGPDAWLANTWLDALTVAGWSQIVARDPTLREVAMPHSARIALPAVWRGGQVAAVPHLGFVNADAGRAAAGYRVVWRPKQALAPAPFGKV